ncbi:MAG: ATP-dependent Clp protease proteolytic subunit [Candidatus Glassbacteria bacterium RIFCSPLOWO2_12_FULL_58_11]|uniref:ATP-dependent Clp protease proteolytic subunit n=1 Tax=Candidatus Glassbacteria bacterium RIFCSPLOWO2_12_FULL_58_11 TaxID=1817867 RepID=A0A1F5Z3L4_9BACT|nr:MAG: ATP-dependent Clp protease proteolytic subunit [Candidatus Glassbacteria bacterium RIFCSPLOWO2_12_FULL_58_11]
MLIVPQVYEKTPMGERAFDIYSRLLQDRIVLLSSYIDDNLSNLVVAQLLFLEAEDAEKDIYLYINSPGGDVTSSLAIYDTMNFIRAAVSTICTGIAGASAALLLSAGAPGKRMCLPNSKILLHQVYGEAEGPAADIQIAAREIERQRSLINKLLAQHTGKNLRKVEKDTDRDFYLDAEQAIEYGIVNQVIQKHILPTAKTE